MLTIKKNVTKRFMRGLAYTLLLIMSVTLFAGCGSRETTPEVWGRAEAKEVDINSKIPGRIVSLLVKEGDRVTQGQVLAHIDNRDIVAQVNQAKANINAFNAQAVQAATVTVLQDQTAKAALHTAQAQLEKARSDLALAESDYNRYSELLTSEAISRQLFDTYRTKYQAAQAAYSQAQAGVATAQAGLLQTNVNAANEEAVRSKVAQAQAALQQVEVSLDETELRAPFDGIITAKYVEEGAMVSQGMPLVALQDPLDNWVNLKVKETELSRYSLQQQVKIQGRDSKLVLDGTIVDISKKAEFATYRATNERGDNDIITFNVKIQVNSDKLRPGMRFKLMDGVNR
ncbi:Auxiliary transport protein, membrane fusion protein (MFP) family protein [uncultured Sporomusa sp.]|uniref:Auxiliary transport protein, membrane fusion protein (MFP) family protein n=1 Tax=uncultured Sporomusa sp. TaxID=307249 RepID=A0A212LMZ1_9FIRM|nr:HlyD family efflux transporter periplasmic adaptor subunit [uncultured Sporomusa sp.]SCM78891.1 Auxiliary transport protein, membrane fusion protein (MFP) family protein [uncultured Sporomusa sp.]